MKKLITLFALLSVVLSAWAQTYKLELREKDDNEEWKENRQTEIAKTSERLRGSRRENLFSHHQHRAGADAKGYLF